MIDLTGSALVSYLLRIIRDTVERHPRFKSTLGTVSFPSNSVISWRDVQVIIRSVTTSGTRLSPNYFLCTQRGRAILAKVSDKPGQLVEWVRETDKTHQTPEAGVYYINVDYFNEQTNDIGLTCQQFKWKEGKITDAEGSQVFFRPGIMDSSSPPQPIDLTTLVATDVTTGNSVQFVAFNQTTGGFMNLLTPVVQLKLALPDGTPLVPLIDFWYQRAQTTTICQTTLGGAELISTPPNISFSISDQDGYVLRPNIDYVTYGNGFIQLTAWSPAGSTLYCNAIVKLDPSLIPGTNPENGLQFDLLPGEFLAPGQVFIHTTAGNFSSTPVTSGGMVILPTLLQPGDYCRWEARIETPQVKALAKKWELNSLIVVDPSTIQFMQPPTTRGQQPSEPIQTSAGTPLLVSGTQQYVLPGIHLAIGDQVIVGDQVVVIVSPTTTETCEVFGSKENINFTLEVKSNDLQTSSDLSEMIKQQLLILGRENAEADGLTVFEATRDFQGVARDSSNTAPSYIYTVSVSASADWKVYVPLVTRLVQYEITSTPTNSDFQGKLQMANRAQALGAVSFMPEYR